MAIMRLAAAALALALVALDGTAFARCKPPPDVAERVGTASTWVYRWTAGEYASGVASRDYHWNNQPTSAQGYTLRLPPNSFSSAYTSVNRVAVHGRGFGTTEVIRACGASPAAGGCTLQWFQRHHPDWIVYRRDQATPAWLFKDEAWIPLDITNPAVQQWIMRNQFLPLLRAGYQGISFDNIGERNDWDEAGVCSVAVPSGTCAGNGGTWRRLYSGAVHGDEAYLRGRVDWLRAATAFINDNGGCSTGNIIYEAAHETAIARLVDAVDIWYDEAGFTGDPNPSSCSIATDGSAGAKWIARAKFVIGQGPAKPMVQQNSICPRGASRERTRAVLEYAVASYLLTKNARTYIAWYFDDGRDGTPAHFNDPAAWPQLRWRHGAALEAMTERNGVYRRRFTNGIALVNPSTRHSVEYELDEAYEDFEGVGYRGRVTLGPVSALILRKR